VSALLDLYQGKCRDNEIIYVPEQAIKFIERFKRVCSRGNLDFSNQLLGVNGAYIL
jgi:hypothetical protein